MGGGNLKQQATPYLNTLASQDPDVSVMAGASAKAARDLAQGKNGRCETWIVQKVTFSNVPPQMSHPHRQDGTHETNPTRLPLPVFPAWFAFHSTAPTAGLSGDTRITRPSAG